MQSIVGHNSLLTTILGMSMIMCPECGTNISDRARVCMYCGFSSADPERPISEQDSYALEPVFKMEIRKWDPERQTLSTELVDVAHSDNRGLAKYFGDWKVVQTRLPSLANAVKDMASRESDTQWVAKISDYYKKLIDEGKVRLVTDKKGEILPNLYDENGLVGLVRLERKDIPKDLTPSLQHLETQAALATVLSELQNISAGIEQLKAELQNDRLALVDSALDKLNQARTIQDSRLRSEYVLMAVSSATDAKHTLMRNFAEHKGFIEANSGKNMLAMAVDAFQNKDTSPAAADALRDLVAITNAVRVECEGHIMLGNMDAAKESLTEFRRFVEVNDLTNRDTLLRIGMSVRDDGKLLSVVDQFSDIAQKTALLKELGGSQPFPVELLEPYVPNNGNENNGGEEANDEESVEEIQ